jgi:hypothetical protein
MFQPVEKLLVGFIGGCMSLTVQRFALGKRANREKEQTERKREGMSLTRGEKVQCNGVRGGALIMMGLKERAFAPKVSVSLEELVPQDHFYRHLQYADSLERVKGYHQTSTYQKAINKRKVWVEPLFAEGNVWHGMRRFRLRRLWRVNCEAQIIAAGQNLKRLLRKRGWGRRPFPTEAVALPKREADKIARDETLKSLRIRVSVASLVSVNTATTWLYAQTSLFFYVIVGCIRIPPFPLSAWFCSFSLTSPLIEAMRRGPLNGQAHPLLNKLGRDFFNRLGRF